ncbi:MAG: type VI secretion system baseplate subunit TssE [Planctomycetes bacterium]|jgi:type VI secretion system protein ImpF|nr:type VI secretion system baseplate subunit TssE [Planctomycetota bacterium]
MAELTPKELLQPCLLDRLSDDEPQTARESHYDRVVSLKQYREAVLRDLKMLLNSRMHPSRDSEDSRRDDIYDFPRAAASVLNYGIPEFCGRNVSGADPAELEELIRLSLVLFEPRISPHSLTVRWVPPGPDAPTIPSLAFEITGDLWAHPAPDHLLIQTEVDLDSGHCHYPKEGEAGG